MDDIEWKEKKVFIDELKRQWNLLWMERIDDKVKAEGIAREDFSLLFVDRGTVITATRDYKPLDFKQILEEHKLVRVESMVSPSPAVGGWGKFAKETYDRKRENKRPSIQKAKILNSPQKKGGRGWLHARL